MDRMALWEKLFSNIKKRMYASPVPWFHPGPCKNKELRSSERTSAAASFS